MPLEVVIDVGDIQERLHLAKINELQKNITKKILILNPFF
jgi:hypothetical protein